jgi:hypothetical protein
MTDHSDVSRPCSVFGFISLNVLFGTAMALLQGRIPQNAA